MAQVPVVIVTEGRSGPETDLTPALAQAIALFVQQGASPVRAAAACKVPRSTWYSWVLKHDRGIEPYKSLIGFILLVRDADTAELEIELRSSRDWQAKAAMIKQRDAQEERQRDPTPEELEKLSDEELERIAYRAVTTEEPR